MNGDLQQDVLFRNNFADSAGGSVYVQEAVSLTITRVHFVNSTKINLLLPTL